MQRTNCLYSSILHFEDIDVGKLDHYAGLSNLIAIIEISIMKNENPNVIVLIDSGSIRIAIARRIGTSKDILLGDLFKNKSTIIVKNKSSNLCYPILLLSL